MAPKKRLRNFDIAREIKKNRLPCFMEDLEDVEAPRIVPPLTDVDDDNIEHGPIYVNDDMEADEDIKADENPSTKF